jgi:hypothetical protein
MGNKPRSTDGLRWALLQPFAIEDLDDPDRTYLWRLRIVQTPLFGVYLHRIDMDDGYRPLHDHPWGFLGLILWGGYTEETLHDGTRSWRTGSMHWMPFRTFHAIRHLDRSPTWTLVLVGRRRADWGFLDNGRWMPHKTYIEKYKETITSGG